MLRNVMRFIAFAMLAVALVTSAEPGRRKGFVRATWERRMLNSFGFDALKKLLSTSTGDLGQAKVITELKEEKQPVAVAPEPVRILQEEATPTFALPEAMNDDFDASVWATVPDDVPAASEPLADEEVHELAEGQAEPEDLAAEGYEIVDPPTEEEEELAAAEEHSEEEEPAEEEQPAEEPAEEEHSEEEPAEEEHSEEEPSEEEHSEEEPSEEEPAEEEHSEEEPAEEEHSEEEPSEEEHAEEAASEEPAEEEPSEEEPAEEEPVDEEEQPAEEPAEEEHSEEEPADEEHAEEEPAAEEPAGEEHSEEQPAEEEASAEEPAEVERFDWEIVAEAEGSAEEEVAADEQAAEEQPEEAASEEHVEEEAASEEALEAPETEYEFFVPEGEVDGEAAASEDVSASSSYTVVAIKHDCPPEDVAMPSEALLDVEGAADSEKVVAEEDPEVPEGYEYVPTPEENPEATASEDLDLSADEQQASEDASYEGYEYVEPEPEGYEYVEPMP